MHYAPNGRMALTSKVLQEGTQIAFIGDINGGAIDLSAGLFQFPNTSNQMSQTTTRSNAIPLTTRGHLCATHEHEMASTLLCQPACDLKAESPEATSDEITGIGAQGHMLLRPALAAHHTCYITFALTKSALILATLIGQYTAQLGGRIID